MFPGRSTLAFLTLYTAGAKAAKCVTVVSFAVKPTRACREARGRLGNERPRKVRRKISLEWGKTDVHRNLPLLQHNNIQGVT
jgi:hypothetical protein